MSTDRLGDEIAADGSMHHTVPLPMVVRIIFIAAGAFVLIVSTLELWRGVLPFNLGSLFFGAILVGAWSVGVPILLAGLVGPSMHWLIEPGRMTITLTNPFRRKRITLTRNQIADLTIREIENDSSRNTFAVVLKSIDGQHFQSRDFGTEAVATGFRQRILDRLG